MRRIDADEFKRHMQKVIQKKPTAEIMPWKIVHIIGSIKNNPTFKDIAMNRSPFFLTVRSHSAFVAKDYYNCELLGN